MTYSNEVVIQGNIVNKIVTPKTAILYVNTATATKVANFPKVVCFGELRDVVVKNFNRGDKVYVLGNIQSSIRNEKNKNRDLLTIFAEEVSDAKSLMENTFHVDSEFSYKPFVNSLKIAGCVTNIRKLTENLFNVTVFTKKNNRISFVTLSYYTHEPDKFVENISVKDNVYVIGNVQTTKKEINGEMRYFQNYVATEIVKQSDEEATEETEVTA